MRPGGRALRPGVVLGALLGVLGLLAACGAPPRPAADPPSRVLQLNLCNSGAASCYTGRAVAVGAAVLRRERPDVVTLNEVCGGDVAELERALAEALPGTATTSAFRAARDAGSGAPYRCRDGGEYGVGVVARGAPGVVSSGIHPSQDVADPEQRAWLCVEPAGAPRAACTTHLSYRDPAVAAAQCRYLLEVVVPQRRVPVVIGADLNLAPAGLGECLPAASARVDDGGTQLVVAPPDSAITARALVDLEGASDHPGLLATLVRTSGGAVGPGGVGGSAL